MEKKIVKLQIFDEVVSLKIADKDEETVRYAAKKLNDRAHTIKERNPSLKASSLLAYLALEECVGSINKDRNKKNGLFKRTASRFLKR